MRSAPFLFVTLASCTEFGAYFANWAQYHKAPFTYTAQDLSPIAPRLDRIMYSFAYFCPPAGTSPMPYWAEAPYGSCSDSNEFQLLSVETKDTAMLSTINGFKQGNSNLKVLMSVGGWNFPSHYFSQMVSSKENRAKFIQSCLSWLKEKNLDGIDLDWEYPCSPKRENPVKITCSQFRSVEDRGGSCPADKNNFPLLVKEMRQAFGSKYLITVASQAAKDNWENMGLTEATPHVDAWHIMSYDYSVSDIPGANVTAINAPLYKPTSGQIQGDAADWSINYSVQGYLKAGVPKEKIVLGIPFYGHTWYVPGLAAESESWKRFGIPAKVQGNCCGPFKETFGATCGAASQLCGTLMYSEIEDAKPLTFYDETTKSTIGYWADASADGATAAGTWISYNDANSIKEITQYAIDQKLGGAFIFDSSMDSMENGEFTYKLMNQIADQITGHPRPAPTPSPPAPSPSPPAPGQCKAISPQVSDAWCTSNCHAVPAYCPSTMCSCA